MRATGGLHCFRRESAITGIWRVVFAWCPVKKGYSSTILVHSRPRRHLPCRVSFVAFSFILARLFDKGNDAQFLVLHP